MAAFVFGLVLVAWTFFLFLASIVASLVSFVMFIKGEASVEAFVACLIGSLCLSYLCPLAAVVGSKYFNLNFFGKGTF